MHSPGHRKAVRRLTALAAQLDNPKRHVQIQSPVVCGARQMPEPDFAIVRGSDDDYTDHLPAAADVECIIEVADSSLERDREEKRPIYARAGVPQYIILNLRNRTAEIYDSPDSSAGLYPPAQIISADGVLTIRLASGETHAVPLAELLP